VLGDLHIASGSECARIITCFWGAGDNLKLLMLDIAQLFVDAMNSHLERNLRQIVDGYRLRFVGLESGFT